MADSEQEDQELLERAIRLVNEDERAQEAMRDAETLARVAEELGIPPGYLERAAKARDEERAAAARRRRTWMLGAVVATAVFVAAGALVMNGKGTRRSRVAVAERSLELYREAEAAVSAQDYELAASKLLAADRALGVGDETITFDDKHIRNAMELQGAIESLTDKVAKDGDLTRRLIALVVTCTRDGAIVDCPEARVSALREALIARGLKIDPVEITQSSAADVHAGRRPEIDRLSAPRVAAIRFDSSFSERDEPFVFARCSAQGTVFDVKGNKITDSQRVEPLKGGHIELEAAFEKSCRAAEKELLAWVSQRLTL